MSRWRPETIEERFSRYVSPEPNTGCWLWTGALRTKGYGSFGAQWETTGPWRSAGAHRASWRLHRGLIPDGLHVLHRCDNRICVNPNHLFLGTNNDNIADKVAKGRMVTIFTPAVVRLIREAVAVGLSKKEIADTIGVSRCAVSDAATGRRWGHVS